ncbi:MAG: polyketide antibiotic transporter, partial [Acidimicrobiia bacterium]
LVVSMLALGGLAVIAGVAGWAGSASQHSGVSLPRALGAAFNTLPAALLVLGAGTLAHGLVPRKAGAVAYGLVAWSFVVKMLGTTGTGGRLLLDLSVFHHVALVPAAAFRPAGAAVLVGLGLAGMLAGAALFQRRDLAEA